MKNSLTNYRSSNQARIFTALVLTGILAVGSGLTLIKSSIAASAQLSAQTTNEVIKGDRRQNQLPRPVANAVLRDLARREGISRKKLQIIDYSQQTWRDGCLELPQPNELCTQALVPGLRVVVSDGKQNWVYHTNSNGRSLRLASAKIPTNNLSSKFPQSVKTAVLQAASARLQQPSSRLNIIQAQQRTWRDGCLELADANQGCTQALVPGWRVVVGSVGQTLVYHTNQTGSAVRLNETASEISGQKLPERVGNAVLSQASQVSGLPIRVLKIVGYKQTKIAQGCERSTFPYPCDQILVSGWEVSVQSSNRQSSWVFLSDETGSQIKLANNNSSSGNSGKLTPLPIPASELPAPLDRGVVFRQISSGGFAGRTYETVLLNDGSLIRVRIGDANDSERSVHRLSPQQVQQFLQLVKQSRFGKFKNLNYPAPQGAADYITYTLTNQEGTIQYNDISQNSLPKNLQEVVNAWNQLVTSAQT
ncbi:MAG: hypothetical protein KME32_16655 [Mojavia pulchra JT2-VF2]|jgi:hypothetical protein|uniref:Uncharacterized protein n=1 Tax=Mojavia pulchra JT2-VF2 TaxID=287848 RepID=A0A951UH51_9NOST|nr:hypothetical protein [Mojavia pulchra JT2-VF2]